MLTSQLQRTILCALVGVLGAGCARAANPNATEAAKRGAEPNVASAETGKPSMDVNAALSVGFTLPRLTVMGVMASRLTLVEAIYFATAQTGSAARGQITCTGTVTATPYGPMYSPLPQDRLVVRNGPQVHEFTSIEAMGDSSAAFAINWLVAPHRLKYVHRAAAEAEATISEQFDGRSFVATVSGWALLDGKRFVVELKSSGATQGGSDSYGAEKQTQFDLTGSITGESFALDVRERHFNNFASSVSVRSLPSMRGSANQNLSAINSVLTFGRETYRFNNVQVETGNREKGGERVSEGVYALAGTILRNEQPFAECTLRNGIPIAVAGRSVIPLSRGGL